MYTYRLRLILVVFNSSFKLLMYICIQIDNIVLIGLLIFYLYPTYNV